MNKKSKDCLFCKICRHELPAEVVFEDKEMIAFLDIYPASSGHILLIPKKHFEWMDETPDNLISMIFIRAKKLMKSLKKSMKADYVSISVVGKDVPHFHVHIIPRYLKDNLKGWPPIKYKKGEKEIVANKIRKFSTK